MRKVLFLFAFLLAVTSITASNLLQSAINQTSFSKKDFADTIKVKLINSIVLIPVEIEGSTKHFLLDTGAQFGQISALFDTGALNEWLLLPQREMNRWLERYPKKEKEIDALTIYKGTTMNSYFSLYGLLKDTLEERVFISPYRSHFLILPSFLSP